MSRRPCRSGRIGRRPWARRSHPEGYQAAVRAGLDAIAAGEVSKVVLARDLVGTVPAGADLRRLVRSLATGYPDTWVYAVDGLIGASPETLVTVAGGTVTARVLAGTVARGADPDSDHEAAGALASSVKDLTEHGFAVRSLVDALAPLTSALAASEQPFTLALPNVWHLATDVEATVAGDTSALDLLQVLHPTAAVAGTPTDAAVAAIARIEPFDRGRYAGPVGWIDARGDGEWAIALRGAQFDLSAASKGRTSLHGARRRRHRRRQRPRGGTARDAREVPPDRRRARVGQVAARRAFSAATSKSAAGHRIDGLQRLEQQRLDGERAYHLRFAGTTCHGASGVEVRSNTVW
jgi:hypothetical protein